jgi:hypothetical protein
MPSVLISEPERGPYLDSMKVLILATTSLGEYKFEFAFPNQGSPDLNKAYAREQLRRVAEETLSALGPPQ